MGEYRALRAREAAVRAVGGSGRAIDAAGAGCAFEALQAAGEVGTKFRKSVSDASVRRILQAKSSAGLTGTMLVE